MPPRTILYTGKGGVGKTSVAAATARMTPDERQMISDLFDRLRATSLGDKDREAEALINQLARATPDSAYKLVQSVLVMEHTLQEAGGRIEDLEAQVAELQNQLNPQPQQKSGGSFLGGLFGGSKPQAEPERQPARSAGSVPPIANVGASTSANTTATRTGSAAEATPSGSEVSASVTAQAERPVAS